jgi:lipopolysaccharide transport system permease protein
MSSISRYVHPRGYLAAASEFLGLLREHRELILELTRRAIVDRHANQFLGPMWVFVRPMFVAVLYIFIFSVVFTARAPSTTDLPLDHTVYILAGILPWLAFQTSMNQSCGLITGNASLLKDFVFRIEILPIQTALAAIVGQLLGTLLVLIYVPAIHGTAYLTWLLLPLLVVLQLAAMIGVGFILASLTVVVRDLSEIVQMFSMIGIFVTPVVYQPDWVPAAFKPVLYANPFSYMIWCYQDVLYYGAFTNPQAWLVFPLLSLGTLIAGFRLFRFLKPYFGDFV